MALISELMVSVIGRQIKLLRGEVDQFLGLAVYVCDAFSAYRQHSYECGCCEVIIIRIYSSTHNFYAFDM